MLECRDVVGIRDKQRPLDTAIIKEAPTHSALGDGCRLSTANPNNSNVHWRGSVNKVLCIVGEAAATEAVNADDGIVVKERRQGSSSGKCHHRSVGLHWRVENSRGARANHAEDTGECDQSIPEAVIQFPEAAAPW